jgi:predicted DNA-binding transcriptional regulator YafY
MDWNLQKKLTPRIGGDRKVSPWALIWRDENYYLAAYDETDDKIKHYRVDKMGKVTLVIEPRAGVAQFEDVDLASYTNRTFGMYGGREETVTLQFPKNLVGVVLDRFGKEADIRSMGEECFRVRAKVAVSGQFFGWLAGIGKEAEIVSPEPVAMEYKEWLTAILDNIK